TRSTSIVHSLSAAAIAPTAASTGASTAPMTPTVSGNSTTVCPSCLMMTRRTLPSWTSRRTASTSCSPATLNDSVKVFSAITLSGVIYEQLHPAVRSGSAGDELDDVVHVEWLGHDAKRAQLQRAGNHLRCAERRHHDHGSVGRQISNGLEQREIV